MNFKLCNNNVLNYYLSQILTVAVQSLITFAAFLLENKNFVIFQVAKNFSFYRGTFYNRCAYQNLTVVVYQQDFVEAHRGIYVLVKTVYVELPTFLSLKLLACDFYYYVHSFINCFCAN